MAIPRKKSRGVQTSDSDYDQAVAELADAVVENLSDVPEQSLEPFEVYAQRMRAKVHSEARHFKARFSKGYQVLMAELAKHDPTKG